MTTVGLYAVLAYDASDFAEMILEASTDVLLELSVVLRLPNPKHDADTVWLNNMGAGMVAGVLKKRGIKEPPMPTKGGES